MPDTKNRMVAGLLLWMAESARMPVDARAARRRPREERFSGTPWIGMAGKFDTAWSDGWSFWRRHVFFRTLRDIDVDRDDIAFRLGEEERV